MTVIPSPAEQEKELADLYEIRAAAIILDQVPDSDALRNQCHENAARHVSTNLGAMVETGWIVMEHDYFCRFIPHSVIEAASGRLIDVTPQHQPNVVLKFIKADTPILRHAIANNRGEFFYPPLPYDALPLMHEENISDEF